MLPGLLAVWVFAAPVAMADGPVADAVGSATTTVESTTVESTTDAVDDTVASTTDAVDDTVGSATNTVGVAGDAVDGTVRSTTDAVSDTVGSAGQAAADLTGSPTPTFYKAAPAPLAAIRERHMPQMCLYVPSSVLSELALVSLPGDAGSFGSSEGDGSPAGGYLGFGLGPVPTVPIPGLGEVPIGAIVALLLTIVLGIMAARAWVNERRRTPAFLVLSKFSRPR